MNNAVLLDDPDVLSRNDSGNMADLIARFPAQFSASAEPDPAPPMSRLEPHGRVWIAAMGGSAFAGEMVASALEADGVPVTMIRGYDLPPTARPGDWLIAQSYSGNTEEVLSVFGQSETRGLSRMAVSSGGRLRDAASAAGVPCLKLPAGYPPRAAAGFGYVAAARLAATAGSAAADPALGDPARLSSHLEAGRRLWGPPAPAADNPAKTIAATLHGAIPLVYAADAARPVLVRWSAQLNENAKAFCHTALLPEQNHNEIVAVGRRGGVLDSAVALFLRLGTEKPPMAARFEATRRLLEARGVSCLDVRAEGDTLMERLWWLCYLGDHVSLYMAALAGVDPTPVAAIDELKKKLSEDARDN